MKEALVRKIVQFGFVIRYWVVLFLACLLSYITYRVYNIEGTQIRDVVAVFTGGCIIITVFYHVLNYEYAQRKFKYDIKASKDLLSFSTALEMQKEYFTNNSNLARAFYEKYKHLLLDGKPRKFQQKLEKEKNDKYYTALLCVINYYESIALGVKQGIMDEEFVKGFFRGVFLIAYNRYLPYIEYRRRDRQNVKIWENFTNLATKWITNR